MRLPKTASVLSFLFPDLLWKVNTDRKEIYLTFDDGPEPAVTPQVLSFLKQYNAKATFFCLGKNVEAYPEIFDQLKKEGHSIGNHSYSHPNGWNTPKENYVNNVELCNKVFKAILFRPPYGKLSWGAYRKLRKQYRIVMWSLITHDYRKDLDRKSALQKLIRSSGPGSIVVFHDSIKAKANVVDLLPAYLEHFSRKGYEFKALPSSFPA